MQEEVLKLILLALEDGSALSRKVLVLFVVQRLEKHYPQASKTAIGHVVQLLYRASCFKVCTHTSSCKKFSDKKSGNQGQCEVVNSCIAYGIANVSVMYHLTVSGLFCHVIHGLAQLFRGLSHMENTT